jgi:hypothetical protein
MKRRSSIVVAPLTLALLSLNCHCSQPQVPSQPQPQAQASASRVLSVPLIHQQTGNWCWAASGGMIMTFLGHPVSQCAQADSEFKRLDCCPPPPSAPQCDQGGWPEFERFEFASRHTESQALSWDAVKAEIDAGRPVAFTWWWLGGGGHMMVLKGYEEDGATSLVAVNDPWPSTIVAPWITYEEYVADNRYVAGEDLRHTHWNDYYAITYVGGSVSPAPGGTSVGAAGGGPAGAPQQPSYPSPEAAAQAAFSLLLQSPALSQSLLHGVTLAGLTVGAGLPGYLIRADSLRKYTAAKDPLSLLVKLGRVVFPVQRDNTVYTSITVRRSPTGWRLASYGVYDLRQVLTSSLGTVAAAGQAILVEVPAVRGISFLGSRSNGLRLVALTTDPSLGLVAGDSVASVPVLFAHLASAIHDTTQAPH